MEKQGMITNRSPRLGTVKAACAEIGGDKPVHPSTYYRGVQRGYYRGPIHPSPGISRVDLDGLAEDIRALAAQQAGGVAA
jgi:hypothetical protein